MAYGRKGATPTTNLIQAPVGEQLNDADLALINSAIEKMRRECYIPKHAAPGDSVSSLLGEMRDWLSGGIELKAKIDKALDDIEQTPPF